MSKDLKIYYTLLIWVKNKCHKKYNNIESKAIYNSIKRFKYAKPNNP
jgi:hypothetical protein